MNQGVLTAKEAARYCRVSLTYFKTHYVRRGCPRVDVSRGRYRVEDLEQWLTLRTVGTFDGAKASRMSVSRTKDDVTLTARARAILERREKRRQESTPKLSLVRGGR